MNSNAAIDIQMVKAFIKFRKDHKRSPSLDSANDPNEVALCYWIKNQSHVFRHVRKVPNYISKPLNDAGLMGEFTSLITFRGTQDKAESFIKFISSRKHNQNLDFEEDEWYFYRDWYYSTLARKKAAQSTREKVKSIFAKGGFAGLESAKLHSKDLKALVIVNQCLIWKKTTGKLPSINSKNKLEKELATVLASNHCLYVQSFIAQHGLRDVPVTLPPFSPEPKPEKNDRLSRLEATVEKLTALVEKLSGKLLADDKVINISLPKKKRNTNGVPVKPFGSHKGRIDASELVGLAVYELANKTQVTVGIENVIEYKSGHKKYILRMPSADGKAFTRKFFRWSTCKELKEISLSV